MLHNLPVSLPRMNAPLLSGVMHDSAVVKSTSASDGQRLYGLNSTEPPAYDSRPSSLHHGFIPIKTSLSKRLGLLYTPIRRYFHSVDLKESRLRVDRKGSARHLRATSLSTSQVKVDTIGGGRSIETSHTSTTPDPSPVVAQSELKSALPTKEDLAYVSSLPQTPAASPRPACLEPAQTVLSSTDPRFTTSATISEGMLHPYFAYGIRKRGHSPSRSDLYAGIQRVPTSRQLPRGSSLLRPLSALFNKSADVLAGSIWSQRTSEGLSESTGSTPINHSRESSLYFERSRGGDIGRGGRSHWTKLAGYVSPQSASRLLPKSLKASSVKGAADERITMIPRIHTRRNRAATMKSLSVKLKSRTLSPKIASNLNTSISPGKITPISQHNGHFFVAFTASHCLLFWVCPPGNAIALGGMGMLVVYAIMMMALTALTWVTFAECHSAILHLRLNNDKSHK